MAKDPNYDDFIGFKTPTQKRNNGMVQMLLSDMKRIDAAITSDDIEQLKSLHIELDGTYQNRIKNWGSSMYGFMKGMGFAYEYLGVDSLQHNLKTMRAQLRGLLFELDPSADEKIKQTEMQQASGEYHMNSKQRKLIADYAEIKQYAAGNMAISIPEKDYPRFKDTLDYMVAYEYISPVDVNFSGYMYFKKSSFDSFSEYVMTQEMEEESVVAEYNNKKVFIVHGHDEQLLQEVELMIHRIGLQPIILKNEASGGRTVIEKIEHYTDVGFGIVLYTACDEGRVKGSTEYSNRARQNVVFEHGYLCAKLSRSRVVALNDSGIEVPSDLAGVVYISRSASDWKNQIMREMREAGLEFDMTRA